MSLYEHLPSKKREPKRFPPFFFVVYPIVGLANFRKQYVYQHNKKITVYKAKICPLRRFWVFKGVTKRLSLLPPTRNRYGIVL